MKPARFDYARPETLADALALLDSHGDAARILAGGQSLVPMLNLRLAAPALLVDIGRLPGLDTIVEEERGIRVGALVRHADLLAFSGRTGRDELLAAALPFVAHQAVRNRGTVCGSLALADPASELPACALCLDAEMTLVSCGGRRVLSASDFFVGLYQTALRPDEMIVDVAFPRLAGEWRFAFEEVCRRHGDFAMAGLAAAFRVEDGIVAESRLAFFGVSDRPVRATLAEAAMSNRQVGDPTGAFDLSDVEVLDSSEYSAGYKRHLMAVLLRRAVGALAVTAP